MTGRERGGRGGGGREVIKREGREGERGTHLKLLRFASGSFSLTANKFFSRTCSSVSLQMRKRALCNRVQSTMYKNRHAMTRHVMLYATCIDEKGMQLHVTINGPWLSAWAGFH